MNAGTSTRWLISSNMLELASATLSYDLPKQWLEKVSMQGLRVYASGENLFLLTKRKGIFPRSNIFSGYSGNADVYLPARVFTFGLNLTFLNHVQYEKYIYSSVAISCGIIQWLQGGFFGDNFHTNGG